MVVMKELQQLVEDAQRYKNQKERYLTYAKELRALAADCDALRKRCDKIAEELDPSVFKQAGKKMSKVLYAEAVENFANIMRAGSSVDTELVEKTYPHLDKWALWRNLQKIKGIEKRKEKTKVFLFLRHTEG